MLYRSNVVKLSYDKVHVPRFWQGSHNSLVPFQNQASSTAPHPCARALFSFGRNSPAVKSRYIKSMLAGLLAVIVASWPATQARSQSQPALGRNFNEILAAAAREGSLNITWSASVLGDADLAKAHMEQFNKFYGLHL